MWLTVERPFAHVRALVSAHVAPPFPKFISFVFDDGTTRAGLRVTVENGTFNKKGERTDSRPHVGTAILHCRLIGCPVGISGRLGVGPGELCVPCLDLT